MKSLLPYSARGLVIAAGCVLLTQTIASCVDGATPDCTGNKCGSSDAAAGTDGEIANEAGADVIVDRRATDASDAATDSPIDATADGPG